MVSPVEKQWLHDRLMQLGRAPDVSLEIIPGGDHCCTGHADEIRADMTEFFSRRLIGSGDTAHAGLLRVASGA